MFSELEIVKSDSVGKVRSKSYFNVLSSIRGRPFWMMIVLLSEFAYRLNESLTLFEWTKLKSLGDGIIAWVIPSRNTSGIDNVLNSSLVHFFEFIYTLFIESFESSVELIEICSCKWESLLHFSWNFRFLWQFHKKSWWELSGLDSSQLFYEISGQHFLLNIKYQLKIFI